MPKLASFKDEDRDVEAHLSAKQDREKAPPRLSRAQVDGGRPQGAGEAPRARPQEALGLRAKLIASDAKIIVSRLRVRDDFLRLARGRKWSAAGLVLQMLPCPPELHKDDTVRVGFTVTRKVGDAVRR